jgi:MFS family permease
MQPVRVLAVTQALCMSGSFLLVMLGGIIGSTLAPSASLATLPVSTLILGLATSVLPSGVLIRRFGRRPVFAGSAVLAAIGCVIAGVSITHGSFAGFCTAAFLMGANNAVVMQYRFAAVEYVELPRASRAISIVMSGALVAAWLGPEVAVRAAPLVAGAEYAGSFYTGSGLYLLSALMLARLAPSSAPPLATIEPARPLAVIAAQPDFRVAVLAALVSYAVMSFIMTATPISMHVMDGHGELATARVIQAHLFAMYLPSLASGWIIARFGDRQVIAAGAVLMLACVAIAAFAGHAVMHYAWALVLLGVGWNFMFIAATTLLTRTYRPHERIQAQTLNDFLVFGSQAGASLAAGAALASIGWRLLNLAALPAIAAVLAALALTRARRAPAPDPAGAG